MASTNRPRILTHSIASCAHQPPVPAMLLPQFPRHSLYFSHHSISREHVRASPPYVPCDSAESPWVMDGLHELSPHIVLVPGEVINKVGESRGLLFRGHLTIYRAVETLRSEWHHYNKRRGINSQRVALDSLISSVSCQTLFPDKAILGRL